MTRAITVLSPPMLRTRWLVALLAFALVAVQTLGFVHRLVHAGPGAMKAMVSLSATTVATSVGEPVRRVGALAALFVGHDRLHDCDAFDQMSHADLLAGTGHDAAPAPVQVEAPAVHAAWHVAAQARGFLARGPPTAT